jgi:tryptophan halogenase
MTADKGPIESIVVVGGGDAGLLTALALKKGLKQGDISVIDDFEEPIPAVGKSTLGNVVTFLHELLEIDTQRLWWEVEMSFKLSVYFEDWCGVKSFHSPLSFPVLSKATTEGDGGSGSTRSLTPSHEDEFHEYYYRHENCEFSDIYGEVAERPGVTPLAIDATSDPPRAVPGDSDLSGFSYQFDSHSLNDFLRTLCRERGVDLIDDRITEVATAGERIESLTGESAEYTADLYVDGSGFKRLLVGELDRAFDAFDLPVDSALVTKTDIPPSEIVSATVVSSGEAGWFWQIDTCGADGGTRDLGYVYSSAHRDIADAKAEFADARPEEIDTEDMAQYEFDSGVLATPWRGNCVAVGNALGFIEPLQSTALSTHCKLAAELTRGLAKHGRVNCEGLRRLFNETTRDTWEEVYDFVSIYYQYSSGSTPFWEDAREIHPEELEHFRSYQESGISAWQERSALTRTGTDLNGIHLYYMIFRSLGVKSAFYEDLAFDVDAAVADEVEAYTAALSDRADHLATYEDLRGTFPGMFGGDR